MYVRPIPVVGVYIAICTATGEMYVGGSINVRRRWRQHRNQLRKGTHGNSRMQAAWNAHPNSFSFATLLVCGASDLLDQEQRFIDRLQPELNVAPFAYSSATVKMTEEQRARMRLRPQSIAAKHKFSNEMLTANEIAQRTGLTVMGVRARLRDGRDLTLGDQRGTPISLLVNGEYLTLRQIAQRYGLPLTTIYSRVAHGWTGDQLTQPRLHRGRNSQ